MAKLNASEIKILDEIAAWKGQAPGFLNRATDFISRPISWATSNLIPDSVKQGMSGIAETIAEKLQDASRWTVNKEEVLRSTKEFDIDSETIIELQKASIHDLDHISEKFISENRRYATLSGVGTGMVGWPGLIADLPTLFMLSLRTIYQIGLCYGYELVENDPEKQQFEVEFMMRVFKISTASNVAEKQKGLAELKDFEASHQDVYQQVGGDFTSKQVSKNAANFLSQRLIKEIVEQTISKKAAGLVPGLGAIFNAGFNYVYLKDVGETAFMLYRERFLLDKKGRQKVIVVEIE
ncbi:MAG: EcsC family protein [Bacteroidia bacterium]|nr:EcsC family protein [Bacteroidia bacterium]